MQLMETTQIPDHGLLLKALTGYLELRKPRSGLVAFCDTYRWLSRIIISSIASLHRAD